MRSHRVTQFALLALVGAIGLAIAGSAGAADRAKPPKLQNVTLRFNFAPDGGQAGYFLAAARGFYAKEGIKIDLQDGKTSSLTGQDVAAGDATFGVVGTVALLQLAGRGADLVSVATTVGKNVYGVFVPRSSTIRSIADLAGHSVLVSAGSPETMFLPVVYALEGIDPNSVTHISVDGSAKFSLYAQGRADGMGFSLGSTTAVNGAKPSRALSFESAGVPFPGYSIVVTRKTLQTKPALVAKFLRATFRGLVAAQQNPAAAVAEQLKARPQASLASLAGQYRDQIPFVCSTGSSGKPYGYQPPEEWSAAAALFDQYGGLNTKLNASSLYTNQFFGAKYKVSRTICP